MGTHPIFESDFDCLTESIGNRTDMRRNTRIMLVFGLIWFSGVLYYARHASEQDEPQTHHNPKHGAHVEKRDHKKPPHDKDKPHDKPAHHKEIIPPKEPSKESPIPQKEHL